MADVTGAPLGVCDELWAILACPCEAHGAVEPDTTTGEIVCTVCARRYPVRDGIPVMLVDEARFSGDGGAPHASHTRVVGERER